MSIQSDLFSYFTPRITVEEIRLIDPRNKSGEYCETSLHLTQMEFGFEDSTTSAHEMFASQQLFKI